MSISSIGIATFGSAAIATPSANDQGVKRDDRPAEPSPAQEIDAAKSANTGQIVDKTV